MSAGAAAVRRPLCRKMQAQNYEPCSLPQLLRRWFGFDMIVLPEVSQSSHGGSRFKLPASFQLASSFLQLSTC